MENDGSPQRIGMIAAETNLEEIGISGDLIETTVGCTRLEFE